MATYRYRYTGESPKESAFGLLQPGQTVESETPLYNGELQHIGGDTPPPWQADVEHPVTEAAQEAAAELGVDPAAVEGSGKGGKVTKADVQAAASQNPKEG